MRRVVALLLVFALAGCSVERVGGESARPSAKGGGSSGPVDLAVPLALSLVTPEGTGAPSTSVLPDPDGGSLTLEPPFLTISRLEGASAQFQEYTGSWGLTLKMTDEDGKVFGDWTAAHVGQQAAVVADGEVICAPRIQEEIVGQDLVITGKYTREQAEDLLSKLTGR